MTGRRWKVRPEGSNWGDFGDDDQIGRFNLLTPARRRRAASEVDEGLVFCLSLPLDCPRSPLNPRRSPPEIAYSTRGADPVMNYPMSRLVTARSDAICDDRVQLSTQYSTQWDALCHIGSLYDAFGSGEREVTYYNGFRAHEHIRGPFDYLRDREDKDGPYGAHALGIETMAVTGAQARGVMVDLFSHVGLERIPVGYEQLMRLMATDGVEVEEGDILCLRTGYDRALLDRYRDPTIPFAPDKSAGLNGHDERLVRWIDECGCAAIVSDNESVEVLQGPLSAKESTTYYPLHEVCMFKIGVPLGELFLLSDLADWLRAAGRNRFLFTAPPLRLPGAVGSPVTGVATV